MSERISEEEIDAAASDEVYHDGPAVSYGPHNVLRRMIRQLRADQLLNAADVPTGGVVSQLRAALTVNVQALHELQAGAARDREEIAKLREALRWLLVQFEIDHGQHAYLTSRKYYEARKLLGEGEG